MRRGHSGTLGWRSENPRHFRSRGGGGPHSRPPRGFGHYDSPRYHPPGSRHLQQPPYPPLPGLLDDPLPPVHDDRIPFRGDHSRARDGPRHQQRQILPYLQRMRRCDVPEVTPFHEPPDYYDQPSNQSGQYRINIMGDIDDRQPTNVHQHTEFAKHHPSPWSHSDDKRHYYNDGRHSKQSRHHDSLDSNIIPDYSGHRPPASDHYGSSVGPASDNSNSFSRSVDDTVDIVRKKLLNRSDPHHVSHDEIIRPSSHDTSTEEEPSTSSYPVMQPEQHTKRRTQHQRQNVKSNCDKIKNKIVHQLFKMDKDRIHKLMDNPNSSHKFEYAISSLINESQNSLNRHLRSVAEKSMYSSTDIINDDNTIYEDTFMKQMQCILEPQDTVFLEDIKPLVMAELNKVLQLNDFDQIYDHPRHLEDQTYDQQDDLYTDYEKYEHHDEPSQRYEEKYSIPSNCERSETQESMSQSSREETSLFERRPNKPDYSEEKRVSSEKRRHSKFSIENNPINDDPFQRSESAAVPLFDPNSGQFSEDDDPFAELDKQYHVAVDHNFIETDDLLISHVSDTNKRSISPNVTKETIQTRVKKELIRTPAKKEFIQVPVSDIKKEIDNQLHEIAKSPVKLSMSKRTEEKQTKSITDMKILDVSCKHISNVSLEKSNKDKEYGSENEKSEEGSNKLKSSSTSQSRKRSTDQRPSHRKEKRKKSESSQSDGKQILNKNIIINVNDCASKASENCEAAKSVFNLFFSKEGKQDLKDAKKPDSSDKLYSDKYVKRKDTPKRSKEKENESKKNTSNTSNHSTLSPNDVSSTSADSSTTKSDSKTKFKTIDMFIEKPKKPVVHQSHRTTVPAPLTTPTKMSPSSQVTPKSKQVKSHVSTKIVKRINSKDTSSVTRFCQTEKIKRATRFTQTDPISLKSDSKATDPFERMKEIDLEIQALLQEKFRLYSSIESKESCSTNTGLGMTVLNVSSFTNTKADEDKSIDAIVENFTNIPVEELEQIAVESTQVEEEMQHVKSRRRKQQWHIEQNKKHSKSETPNISLIEQIITDDRPVEEVFKEIDVIEETRGKNNKKTQKKPKKKSPFNCHLKKEPVKKLKPIRIALKAPQGDLQWTVQMAHAIKDCFVLLERTDISKYMKPKVHSTEIVVQEVVEILNEDSTNVKVDSSNVNVDSNDVNVGSNIVNDMQFDMLDVSEDIVIGDMCEIKTVEEKDASDIMPINEEIILDNSQSSCDEAVTDNMEVTNNECKMYDYSGDENLRRDAITVTGNADAVLAIECINNDFIAACLDGNVYHFSNDGQLLNTLRGSNLAVTCLTIVKEKYGTTVYTGSLDSRIRYYDLETGLEKGPECNVLSPIQTMDKAWDTVFVGTRTGFVLQFECKNNMLIPVSTVKFSEQSILALRAMKEGPRKVLLVAARAENVTIKDAQSGLLLRTLEGPKMTVYTLLYEDGKVYCGTSSNLIHAFDYATGSHVGSHEGGKGAVCLRASGGLLFAGCYDGCVYIYREGDTCPLAQLRGPSIMLLSLAILGSKIIAGYKDRSLYIWKIPHVILQEMIL